MIYLPTCALGLVGGVWAWPVTVIPCPGVDGPRTLCAPGVRGRLEGGTGTVAGASPGGGEEVPAGGEEVPAF